MTTPRLHVLKTWPWFFDATWRRVKLFDVRIDDRDFRVGDFVILAEYDPVAERLTGREIFARMNYILAGDDASGSGLKAGYCVLGLNPTANYNVRA